MRKKGHAKCLWKDMAKHLMVDPHRTRWKLRACGALDDGQQ